METAIRRALLVAVVAGSLIPPAAAVRTGEADDQFAVAAGQYERQQWKLAVEEFQTFLKKYPGDPRASQGLFFLGEALVQVGKLDEARQQFRAYAGRDPEGKYARAALFRAGEAAYLSGKFEGRQARSGRFLAKYPADRLNAYVLSYLGEVALRGATPSRRPRIFVTG